MPSAPCPLLIESTNALPLPSLKASYLPDRTSPSLNYHHAQTGVSYSITLETSTTIPSPDFTACFDLIARTSATAYAASSVGWSPAKKRKEMALPDLRYLLVKASSGGEGKAGSPVEGFLSFMLTYEDGREVVYCYEIHLASGLCGSGLGKQMMEVMEGIGKRVGVEKVMLTVFVENRGALKFYERLGYVEDEYSPRPRRLRNGVVKKPDYTILSKPLL